MAKRSFPIFLLTATFLLSAWGNVFAAAFCPRYSARDGSVPQAFKQTSEAESGACHHEMAEPDMDMAGDSTGEMELTPIRENAEPADTQNAAMAPDVLELPNQPCGHCWMHSQPSSGAATIVALRSSPQSVEASAPPADFAVAKPFTFTISITPFEHGPPGTQAARHLLINVFRI